MKTEHAMRKLQRTLWERKLKTLAYGETHI